MKTYFISDTHFFDGTILRYENRPFESVEQMNRTIVDNWNSLVNKEDEVWFLGDFSIGDEEADRILLSVLNGRKFMVKGNHDMHRTNEQWRKLGFTEVYDLPVIYKDFFILSHMPLYICSNMPYANIYGHVHSNPTYKDVSRQSVCVCVERWDYKPVEFQTLYARMKGQD